MRRNAMTKGLFTTSILISLSLRLARADFTYTAPAECQNWSVAWAGGSPPFYLLLAGSDTTARNVSIPSSAYNGKTGNYSFQLDYPQEQIFIAALSDSSGLGSLGISSQLTVNGGSTGCNTNAAPAFQMNFNTSFLQTCQNFVFDHYSGASQPLTVYGLIPGGDAFSISIPSSSPTTYTWIANIATGTTVIFIPQDSKGNFADSSDFIGTGSGSTTSCLNSTSPQSTSRSAPTSTSGSNSKGSSPTSGSPAPSNSSGGGGSSGGSTGGSSSKSNTGAIVGGVVGGLAALAILAAILFFCMRRRNAQREKKGRPGFTDAAFGGKKKNKNQIDLLGDGRRGDENPENGYLMGGVNGSGGRTDDGVTNSDLEPTPFMLPGPNDGRGNSEASYDPYAGTSRARPMSDVGSNGGAPSSAGWAAGGAAGSKAAMASLDRQNAAVPPNAPARFLVHEDAGSLEGDDDEEYSEEGDTVDLPPQYNSLGVLVPPERRPSRRRSVRRSAEVAGVDTTGEGASSTPHVPPAIPETTAEHSGEGPST